MTDRLKELDILIATGRGDVPGAKREPLHPEVQEALRFAMRKHNMSEAQILGGRQFREFVDARADVARRLSDKGWGYTRIGRALGIHHTTVLNLLAPRRFREACCRPDIRGPIQVPDLSGEWAI